MKHDHEAPGFRHARVEAQIREELASLLRDDIADPELEGVSVTAVVLTPDYRTARVHFVVPRGRPRTAAERAFQRATPFLRGRLSEALDLKRTPDLRFVYEAEV